MGLTFRDGIHTACAVPQILLVGITADEVDAEDFVEQKSPGASPRAIARDAFLKKKNASLIAAALAFYRKHRYTER